MSREPARGAFDTTQWSLVLRAEHAETSDGAAALEELCRTYWFPIYCFARRRSPSREDAEDLTQGFFADLLERGALHHADCARGRFRSFLLTSFRNYCSHERERAGAQKRGGGCAFVSLEAIESMDEPGLTELSDEETATQLFDRKWAMCVIESATVAVQKEYAAIGKGRLFDALRPLISGGFEDPGYASLAPPLGMTGGAVKVAAFRLRRRLAWAIRDEVARTVADPAHVDEEMRHLLAAVGG